MWELAMIIPVKNSQLQARSNPPPAGSSSLMELCRLLRLQEQAGNESA